jgi:hypothetical protein
MKTILTPLFLCLLTSLSLLAEPPKSSGPPDAEAREARMLGHLLRMEDAELSALRTTIERIEKMSPEEKAMLREKIQKLERMPPEEAQAMRQRFKDIDPEVREQMRERWLQMEPEARREWRQKLREMSREERAEVFEQEGFLPGRGMSPKEGPPPPMREGPPPPKPL